MSYAFSHIQPPLPADAPPAEMKRMLVEKLKEEHCFWSYDRASIADVPDDIIIEKTLIYLDLPEIKQLYCLYSPARIKRVWLHNIVPQGEYYYTLNRFLAWYLFGVKRPATYLKAMETRHFNRLNK